MEGEETVQRNKVKRKAERVIVGCRVWFWEKVV